ECTGTKKLPVVRNRLFAFEAEHGKGRRRRTRFGPLAGRPHLSSGFRAHGNLQKNGTRAAGRRLAEDNTVGWIVQSRSYRKPGTWIRATRQEPITPGIRQPRCDQSRYRRLVLSIIERNATIAARNPAVILDPFVAVARPLQKSSPRRVPVY